MSTSPNSRLKQFIESIDDSYEDIARKTGYARRTWQRQVEEGASIKSDYLLKLRELYGADIAYILTGERANPSSQIEYDNDNDYFRSLKVTEPMFDPAEFVSVPYYPNVYASGGQGLIAENATKLNMTFRQYFFKNTINSIAANCFMIRLKGDSMTPLYPDGSDLLIDKDRRKIKEGPGFLVRIEDSLYCKLCSQRLNGKIRLTSINKNFEPFEVTPGEAGFEIIGEVVWHATKSKYI